MHDLCSSNNVVSLVIHGYCVKRTILDRNVSMMSVHCTAVTQVKNFRATNGVAYSDANKGKSSSRNDSILKMHFFAAITFRRSVEYFLRNSMNSACSSSALAQARATQRKQANQRLKTNGGWCRFGPVGLTRQCRIGSST